MACSSSDNIEPDSFQPNDSSDDVTDIPTATAQQSQSAQSGGAVSAEASSPESSAAQSYTVTVYGPWCRLLACRSLMTDPSSALTVKYGSKP